MNNLTTPMAILISGILIALVIAFKDNSPKYSFVTTSGDGYFKLNTQTGYVCYGNVYPKVISNLRNNEKLEIVLCDE